MDFDMVLIEKIKEHPILYNSQTENYKNHSKRNRIWGLIADELDIHHEVCRKRWKNIRDTYNRTKHRFDIVNRKPSWKYFDSLRFLDEVLTTRGGKVDDLARFRVQCPRKFDYSDDSIHSDSADEAMLSPPLTKGATCKVKTTSKGEVKNEKAENNVSFENHLSLKNNKQLTSDLERDSNIEDDCRLGIHSDLKNDCNDQCVYNELLDMSSSTPSLGSFESLLSGKSGQKDSTTLLFESLDARIKSQNLSSKQLSEMEKGIFLFVHEKLAIFSKNDVE